MGRSVADGAVRTSSPTGFPHDVRGVGSGWSSVRIRRYAEVRRSRVFSSGRAMRVCSRGTVSVGDLLDDFDALGGQE